MSLGPLYVLLEKCLFKSFAHFLTGFLVFLEWSHMSSLSILKIKPLSEVSLANMFSHIVGSLHLNAVFFNHAEAFYFDEVPFVYSFLYVPWVGNIFTKILLHGISEIFLPMFSSRTFMVLQLIFKSFIHLEFIFVYAVSWWSSVIFLQVAVQISQHHLLKRLFLLHFMLLPPLSNINWP